MFIRVCVLFAALAACSSPAPPRDNFYRLEVSAPNSLPKPALPGVLEVGRLDTDGVLAERALVYQDADGVLARYRYDLWSDAPAQAVAEQLEEYLRTGRAAETVVTPTLRVPPDWALRGRLRQFESLPASDKVVVRMALSVVSARDGTLVLQQDYTQAEPAGSGPDHAAAALGRATSAIFARFLADLAQAPVPQQRR